MLDRLKSIFSSDGRFVPSTSVFPEINAQGIARKLNIEKRAKQNANRGLPETKSTTLDSVEMEIVGEIGEARRQGIQNYQINMDVYSERLARATDARKEVDSVAGKTQGDFRSEVLALETALANPVDKVRQWYEFMQSFREEHGLKRPAEERSPVIRWVALIVIILLVESALNGYLSPKRTNLGFLAERWPPS